MKNANPLFPGFRATAARAASIAGVGLTAAAGLGVSVGLSGCGKEKAANMLTAAATGTVKSAADYFAIDVGGKPVRMQLAVRPPEMQRGLMDRRDLGKDDGMLFVFDKPQKLSFWMRGTPTPLDIGYFDAAGTLQEVYPLHPFDEANVSSNSRELQFALEMNQGWYRENGVKPGAKLDLKALAAAMKERGFSLKKFGLNDDK